MADTSSTCNVLQNLISEYDTRAVKSNEIRYQIGDIRWDSENKLFVCVGRINAEYVWRELNPSSDR